MRIDNEVTNTELLKELGARLRHERITQKVKQEEMAKRCGLARTSLVKLENGDGGVRLVTVLSVMRQLGILHLLEVAIPAIELSPNELVELERRHKSALKRVRDGRKPSKVVRTWGDGTSIGR